MGADMQVSNDGRLAKVVVVMEVERNMNSEAFCPKYNLLHEPFLAESSLSCFRVPKVLGTFVMALTFFFMTL